MKTMIDPALDDEARSPAHVRFETIAGPNHSEKVSSLHIVSPEGYQSAIGPKGGRSLVLPQMTAELICTANLGFFCR